MKRLADIVLGLALLAAAAASLLSGSAALSPGQVAQALTGHAAPEVEAVVVSLRLPRLVLALLVGAALALAGAALQSLLANPLADPFLLGISGGARRPPPSRLWSFRRLRWVSCLLQPWLARRVPRPWCGGWPAAPWGHPRPG